MIMNKVINISSNGIKQAIDDLVNENELLQDKLYKQKDEIERLSKEVTKYDEILCERNNEVDRLNNIINELIEYGENCLENLKDQEDYICESIDIVSLLRMIHHNYIDKLKELKEGNK